jgi:alginate O-acetyltransferase complex protein AlgI
LGISYFTFRAIHYLVEVNRGKFPAAGYFDFILYITFFPTILAGPIERFENFQPQKEAMAGFSQKEFFYGLGRIVQGLFKKLVLSATLYQMVTPYYGAVAPTGEVVISTWQLWMLNNLYMLYLYLDFSGYSDIAIGTSRLFGYKIMENFNWPLLKPNVAKFWANWHISLTRWLQEYIYFTLGGNKKGLLPSILFAFITMGLFGLWHGSGSMGHEGLVSKTIGLMHYVMFGFYHAALIVIYRFWRKYKEKKFPDKKPSKTGYVLGVILTYEAICLGFPLFLHPVTNAISIYAKIFGMNFNFKLLIIKAIMTIGGGG